MLIWVLSSIFCVFGLAAEPPPVLGPAPSATVTSAPVSAPAPPPHLNVADIGESCYGGATNSVPEKIRKYCATAQHTRYFWEQAKKDLQKDGALTPELAEALDGENPCLDYYQKLVEEREHTRAKHDRDCKALMARARQAKASCDAANSCLAQQAQLSGEAAETQKKYAGLLGTYEKKIDGFQQTNNKYMGRLKEEVKSYSNMPSAKQLQKESGVSEPINMKELRGIDADGKPVKATGASAPPNETYRVDAARTQSVNLVQHQQRLQEASEGAIGVKEDLGEHRKAVEKEKSQTERTAAKLGQNQQALAANGAGLGSMGNGLLSAASALAGNKGGAGGTISPSGMPSLSSGTAPAPSAEAPATAKSETKPNALEEAAKDATGASLKGTLLALNEATNDGKKHLAKDFSLRDRLINALKAADPSTATPLPAGTGETKAADAAFTLLKAAPEGGNDNSALPSASNGSGFSLANSETDAQIQKMIGELGDTPAAVGEKAAHAVQEVSSSLSLFFRVTGAYQKILHRGGP